MRNNASKPGQRGEENSPKTQSSLHSNQTAIYDSGTPGNRAIRHANFTAPKIMFYRLYACGHRLNLLASLAAITLVLAQSGCNSSTARNGSESSGERSGSFASTDDKKAAVVDWPNFRGPDFQSVTTADLPLNWDLDQGIRWKSGLPGRGASSPVIHGDRIWLTAYDGFGLSAEDPGDFHDLRHHLLCFEKQTGTPLWQREINGTHLEQKINPELARHGFASSTPVTDGEKVFAYFGVTGIFAFDVDGNPLWQRNLGLETNYFGSSASLLLHEDLVIVNASIESETVFALNKDTGAVVWWISDIRECWSLPVIGMNPEGKPELVISAKNVVAGYNPANAQQAWHCQGIQDYVVSTPVIVDGICYLSGGKEKQTMAIRLGGRGDVEQTHKIWEKKKIGSNVSSPVFYQGRLYIFHDSGIVQVINAENGEIVNRHRTATSTRPFASPLLAANRLYMPFQDAGIGVFQADEKCEELSVNALPDESPLIASIVPSGDQFFFRSDQYLYCVDGQSSSTGVFDWNPPADHQQVTTVESCMIEPQRGWTRRYLLFLTPRFDETIRYLLMPYQSVITDEQTRQAGDIMRQNRVAYDRLIEQFEIVEDGRRRAAADQVAMFDDRYQELEKETKKLNNEMRIKVKQLFSEEQMEKHNADAAASKAHIKPE